MVTVNAEIAKPPALLGVIEYTTDADAVVGVPLIIPVVLSKDKPVLRVILGLMTYDVTGLTQLIGAIAATGSPK